MHILLPKTDNCPLWISGMERMTIESINFHERMLPTQKGWNPQPPNHQSDAYPTEPQMPADHFVCSILYFNYYLWLYYLKSYCFIWFDELFLVWNCFSSFQIRLFCLQIQLLTLPYLALWVKFSADDTEIFFLFFPENWFDISANCLHWRQFARNVKACFLGKTRKKSSIRHLLNQPRGWLRLINSLHTRRI